MYPGKNMEPGSGHPGQKGVHDGWVGDECP